MPPVYKVQKVSEDLLHSVITIYRPVGLFLCRVDNLWVAVDNTTGNAWTEEFRWKRQAVRWLHGKFEVSDNFSK